MALPGKPASWLPAAEGIRGVACLLVLVAHAVTMFFPRSVPYLSGSGKIGVWPFFVLSAYLHWWVFMKLIALWPANAFATLAATFLAITIGAVLHVVVERPLDSLRRNLNRRFSLRMANSATTQ